MTSQALQDQIIHEAINGPTQIGAGQLAVVNPSESIPVGVGPGNEQPFMSGSSQNVRTSWVEQGWGHDSQRWPSYPFSVGDNPARRHSRMSSLSDEQRVNMARDSWVQATAHEAERQGIWARLRRSGANSHGAIVNIPTPVPWVDTVPTYSGAAVAHPGVDVPLGVLYGP